MLLKFRSESEKLHSRIALLFVAPLRQHVIDRWSCAPRVDSSLLRGEPHPLAQ